MFQTELKNILDLFKSIEGQDELGKASWRKINDEIKTLIDFFPFLVSEEYQMNTLKLKNLASSWALYYSKERDIVISTKKKVKFKSFIHGVGHHIDNHNGNGKKYSSDLMKDKKWLEVVQCFRKQHDKYGQKTTWINSSGVVIGQEWDSHEKLCRSKTEIFARGFEIYVAHKLTLKEIVETKSHYKEDKKRYPMSKKSVDLICSFYDGYFAKITQKEIFIKK